jgi:hypothetical protein
MKKKLIIFLFVLSFYQLVEAQSNIEWMVKTGLYAELYKFPLDRYGNARTYPEDNPYSNFSITCNLKKYKTLIQVNYNLKYDGILPMFGPSFPGYFKGANNNKGFIPKIRGDTVLLQAWHCNWLNILYDTPFLVRKNQLLAGFGIISRYDLVNLINGGNSNGTWPYTVNYKTYARIMPSLHAEYLYKPFKHFFISAHLDYAYFFVAPKHYLQFGLSLGSNFSF